MNLDSTGRDGHDAALRARAVGKHEDEAADFAKEYQVLESSGYLASAFLLGRGRIDAVLDDGLSVLPAGADVLDAGCGTGSQIQDLTRRGYEVVGVEPAGEMRRRAIDLNPGVSIHNGSILSLPFPYSSFDAVIALEVLRYLPAADVRIAYREMQRVLRPNGLLVVTLVNRWAIDGYYIWEKVMTRRALRTGLDMRAHCEFVTPQQVRRDLAGYGFDRVKTVGRLLIPLRWAYKVGNGVGRVIAKVLDPIDKFVSRIPGTTPFAGHLIVLARRPARRN